MAANSIAGTISRWFIQTSTWASDRSQPRTQSRRLRRALATAFHRFEQAYPELVGSLFDEHFLRHGAAPLLAAFDRPNAPLPTARDLTLAWDKQFGPAQPALHPRRIAMTLPAAARLLQWLAEALDLTGGPPAERTTAVNRLAQPAATATLVVQGDLDRKNYALLLTEAEALYRRGIEHLKLDLREVQTVELTGLFAIHAIAKLMRGAGMADPLQGWYGLHQLAAENLCVGWQSRLTLVNPSPAVAKLLRDNHLDEILAMLQE